MMRYWNTDGAWLAIDEHGYVAVLTTAGVAPIPTVVLDRYVHGSPENAVKKMPLIGDCSLRVRYPQPEDFIGFASRGFFAYDWQDAHRTRGFSNGYDLIAVPSVPILRSQLPPELLQLADLVTFNPLAFEQSIVLPVEQLILCERG